MKTLVANHVIQGSLMTGQSFGVWPLRIAVPVVLVGIAWLSKASVASKVTAVEKSICPDKAVLWL